MLYTKMYRYYQNSSDDETNGNLSIFNPLIETISKNEKNYKTIMRVPLIMSLTDEGFSYIKQKCRFPSQLNRIAISCWLEGFDYFYLLVNMKSFTYSSYHYDINNTFGEFIDINVPIQILKIEIIESIFDKLNALSKNNKFSKSNFIKTGENVNALKDPTSFQDRLTIRLPLFDINIENAKCFINKN